MTIYRGQKGVKNPIFGGSNLVHFDLVPSVGRLRFWGENKQLFSFTTKVAKSETGPLSHLQTGILKISRKKRVFSGFFSEKSRFSGFSSFLMIFYKNYKDSINALKMHL